MEKLQDLNGDNSKGELLIKKLLTKSKAHFFKKAKKDKLDSAMSIHSHCESVWGGSYES